ncbi:hypothetical protein K461DRAFT_1554 [Myriangium duriaei CBS 260.36]|uniref:DUF7719 domain-containing protein n=1 Tax=Myriangium duriaei CBS 260.36 TaxID=1168546 RepID=A0A9P4JBK2_9PEZI|nr:hypothetical protein K461DRAFT_1554 [Myriangium duriaei CBS 260.36]
MSSDSTPRNRRERRADAKKSGKQFTPLTSAADIPMTIPSYARSPDHKTLLDLAAERQSLLDAGQPFSPVHGDGLARDEAGRVLLPRKSPDTKPGDTTAAEAKEGEDDAPIGPLGESLFLTVTLTILHFTLNLLVHNQYGHQAPSVKPLIWQTLRVAPWLVVPVYALKHPDVAKRPWVKNGLHFLIGTGAGCWMLWIGNRESYMDVMARAPSVGAVWIWSVVEMRLEWGVVSLGICGVWLWWHGFSLW